MSQEVYFLFAHRKNLHNSGFKHDIWPIYQRRAISVAKLVAWMNSWNVYFPHEMNFPASILPIMYKVADCFDQSRRRFFVSKGAALYHLPSINLGQCRHKNVRWWVLISLGKGFRESRRYFFWIGYSLGRLRRILPISKVHVSNRHSIWYC